MPGDLLSNPAFLAIVGPLVGALGGVALLWARDSLAALRASLNTLTAHAKRCEVLEGRVLVLEDHKRKDELRVEKLDTLSIDVSGLKRDVQTLFEQNRSLPAHTAAAVVAELRPYIRADRRATHAAN